MIIKNNFQLWMQSLNIEMWGLIFRMLGYSYTASSSNLKKKLGAQL